MTMYNLTFKNGKIEELSDKEAEILLQMMVLGKEKFLFKKSLYSFSSVSDIKPVKEDYPALPPAPPLSLWTKEKKLKALRSIREGFLKGVSDRNNLKPNQQIMLSNMDRLIKRAEEAPTMQSPINFKEIYGGI